MLFLDHTCPSIKCSQHRRRGGRERHCADHHRRGRGRLHLVRAQHAHTIGGVVRREIEGSAVRVRHMTDIRHTCCLFFILRSVNMCAFPIQVSRQEKRWVRWRAQNHATACATTFARATIHDCAQCLSSSKKKSRARTCQSTSALVRPRLQHWSDKNETQPKTHPCCTRMRRPRRSARCWRPKRGIL